MSGLTFPLEWSHAQQLGRCPKPHQRRCLWTPQGTLSLDPFLAPRLERVSFMVNFRG
ncbi:MAG: glycosyl hydrolase family 65 protein [Christensenellales bacterium]